MTTALTNVAKADTAPGILAQFQAQLTNPINAANKWCANGFNPFLGNYPLGGYYLYSTSWGGYVPLKNDFAVTSAPDSSSLPSANVVLGEVTMALRNACVLLSNARQLRLIKYYYDQYYNLVAWADWGIVLAHMTDNFRMGDPGGGIAGGDITAAGIDSFVNTLSATLAGHQGSTYTFIEYWCHAACHSNHGSRNRR